MADKEDDLNSLLEFYITGVGMMVIAPLGLVGNMITVLIFSCRKMKLNPTFTSLVIWLAVLDSIFLILVLLMFSLPVLSVTYKIWVFPELLPSLLPLTSITLTASVYCVVVLALERYLHITKPNLGNKGSFFGYILPVLVFSTCYNFPKFLEFSTHFTTAGVPIVKATDFRKNSDYSFYVIGLNFIFMGVIPFSALISLNVAISRRIKSYFTYLERRESAMNVFLYFIVLVQLICHTPRTGLNVYEIYMVLTEKEISMTHSWLVDISHLLLVLSASSNVLIYAAQDMRFRYLLMTDLKKVMVSYRTGDLEKEEKDKDGQTEDTTVALMLSDNVSNMINKENNQNNLTT